MRILHPLDMLRPDMERQLREERGRRIRERRRALGMTSTEHLASRAGVSGKTIQNAELGRRDTDAATLEAIADALGWTRDQLDGDLRLTDEGGSLGEMRREIALIWRVLQVEFSDTAARIADEYDSPPSPPDPRSPQEQIRAGEEALREIDRIARPLLEQAGNTSESPSGDDSEGSAPPEPS